MYKFALICALNIVRLYYGKNSYANDKNITYLNIIVTLVQYGILTPIIEECIFRLCLPMYTDNMYTINIIFSLAHITNIKLVPHKSIVIQQICMVFILGCYLSGLNNIWCSIIAHILYNIIGITCDLMIAYKKYPQHFSLGHHRDQQINMFYTIRLNRSKSCTDLQRIVMHDDVRFVDVHTLKDNNITSSIKNFHKLTSFRKTSYHDGLTHLSSAYGL